MSTEPSAPRYELAELLVEALSLATDAQVAAVLRAWADDATLADAPRSTIANLIYRMRAAPQADCLDPERAAGLAQRINEVLAKRGAQKRP